MNKLQKFGRYSRRVINRLTKRKEDIFEDADWNFDTLIGREVKTISWRIENVHHSSLNTGEYYESPSFCTGFSIEVKWTLRIYPKGRYSPGNVAVFLCKISDNPRTRVQFLLRVNLDNGSTGGLDEKDTTFLCEGPCPLLVGRKEEVEDLIRRNQDQKFYMMMLDPKELESTEFGTDKLFPDTYLPRTKSLYVFCSMIAVYEEQERLIAGPSSTLHTDFTEMYRSGKFSDVTLHVGKKSFPAHKAILSARSKVFAAMFDHDMKEARTNEIVIEDIEPSVMSNVLHYIYSGRMEYLSMEKAIKTFSVADRYSLTELQQWCVQIIIEHLYTEFSESIEYVCQIAILAYMHSEPKLKLVTNSLFRNHEIFKRKEWKQLIQKFPQLASDILEAVNSDFNTDLKATRKN